MNYLLAASKGHDGATGPQDIDPLGRGGHAAADDQIPLRAIVLGLIRVENALRKRLPVGDVGEGSRPAQGSMPQRKQRMPDASKLSPGLIVQDDVRLGLVPQRYAGHAM